MLLGLYHSAVGADGSDQSGKSLDAAVAAKGISFEPIFDVLPIGKPSVLPVAKAPSRMMGQIPPMSAHKRRTAVIPIAGSTEVAQAAADLVPVLLDLTFYEDDGLVSAALGLLVRQHEQRKVLEQQGRKVQLLALEQMIRMYGTFDRLLTELSRLSERRRLFSDELYQAVQLMSLLTMHCYEEEDGANSPRESTGSAPRGLHRGKSFVSRGDHTAGM